MARNDGVDRTSVRNLAVSDKAVGNTQQHNEREKDSYRNPDITVSYTHLDVYKRQVFSHAGEQTLDHDTRRAVRDGLRGRHQLDMISFQLVLIAVSYTHL